MNENVPQIGHNNPPVERTRDMIIMEWDAAKKALTEYKDKEAKLRKEVVAMEFAGAKAGTNRVQLGNGYALKAVVRYNYKITKNEAVEPPDYSHLPGILAQLPPAVAQGLVKWTPELSESAYKQLTEEEKKIANQFLLITDGSSSLELELPKVKKTAG